MKIIEALAKEIGIRLSNSNDRWIVAKETANGILFTVYEFKPYARNSIVLVETENEERAVEMLLGKE